MNMAKMAKTDGVLLQDTELEQLVIGTIMSSATSMDEVRSLLDEDCFYDGKCKQIYQAISAIDKRGETPDPITVLAELKKVNDEITPFELMQLAGSHSFVVQQHAARLHDLAIRRKFFELGHKLLVNSYAEVDDIEDVTKQISESLAGLFRDTTIGIGTLGDAIEGVYDITRRNLSNETALTGTTTGFEAYDKLSGGLQKSDLIIIAGESSMGKTSLATSICLNAGLAGAKVAFYSMEMEKEKLAARIIASTSGITANRLMYAPLESAELQKMDDAVARLSGVNFYFDDKSTSNIDNILASIRAMKMKYDIDGAVVDYLQILNVNMRGVNKEQQMADVTRRLKNLAKDLGIWIIALSQLNRDSQNTVPNLNRLRDSGQITEAADVVMLIYRPEYYGKAYPEPFTGRDTAGTAMIDVAKGRNIGTTKFLCGFNKSTTCFYDTQVGRAAPPPREIANPFRA